MAINQERLKIANQILAFWEFEFIVKANRLYLRWRNSLGNMIEKPWLCRNGDAFPSIYDRVPTGGTHQTAITQLANWIRDKPVYFFDTWAYWCGDSVKMKPREEILSLLRNSDYPKERKCHWCGNMNGRFDWYAFGKKHSGMGCLVACKPLRKLMEAERSKTNPQLPQIKGKLLPATPPPPIVLEN